MVVFQVVFSNFHPEKVGKISDGLKPSTGGSCCKMIYHPSFVASSRVRTWSLFSHGIKHLVIKIRIDGSLVSELDRTRLKHHFPPSFSLFQDSGATGTILTLCYCSFYMMALWTDLNGSKTISDMSCQMSMILLRHLSWMHERYVDR